MEATELDLSAARQPGAAEVSARTNIFFQLMRFAVLNLKMVKMITKGHTGDQ